MDDAVSCRARGGLEPIGLAPIFLGITYGPPSSTQRRVGLRAALIRL
jgi:small neutral amino acid transporter SnatA (MarC family)